MSIWLDIHDYFLFQNNLQRTLSGGKGPEFVVQAQDGTMTIIPNIYNTNSTTDNGQPLMVTLNPYSSQLVDNINKMMKEGSVGVVDGEMEAPINPQLARLTATLRKKRCDLGHPGPCRKTCNIQDNGLQMVDRGSMVNPKDVVFRAVSPHGHVYWEINPGKDQNMKTNKSQTSSSDENTTSDLQNISDFSDDDLHRAHSEMSRQSSSRFSESRPLIYTSSASTSPGHSAGSSELARHTPSHIHHDIHNAQRKQFARGVGSAGRPGWPTLPHNFHEEVYAYAATDFSGTPTIHEQVQSQVQIKDLRTMPVSVKSKEYIMAKIADYTERNSNHI